MAVATDRVMPMATDRFIITCTGELDIESVFEMLEDYLGDALVEKTWLSHQRVVAQIAGKLSWPLRRQAHASETHRFFWAEQQHRVRAIEVVVVVGVIDVMTRQMDAFTMDLASGFARRCARFFNGELEMDE